MLQLTPDEQTWLEAYRQALNKQYPDTVIRMVIYGSKARGEAHPDSDVDVLLIVRNDAGHLKRPLRRIGYELAATSDAVPSLLAYTQDEWENRKESGSPFQQAVERDAVSVFSSEEAQRECQRTREFVERMQRYLLTNGLTDHDLTTEVSDG